LERIFTRERFGRPQFMAGGLLLVFLVQCGWLVAVRASKVRADEFMRITEGSGQWLGERIAGTPYVLKSAPKTIEDAHGEPSENELYYNPDRSPLWYLIAAAPNVAFVHILHLDSFRIWGWLAALPYLIFGALLGASVWYVARRLYGNAGGYIALSLYCFSPGIIQTSALWFRSGEIGMAWGAFGAVFTAIAVAHTLYAPREVVLWNWRRILLMAVSLVLAIGSQFSLVVVVPVALGFMLYLAPARMPAALTIWFSACALAFFLLYAAYFFHGGVFWQGLRHAGFFGLSWQAFTMPGAYKEMILLLGQNSPALLVAVPAALVTYFAWPRTRYFGNTAPLLVAVLLLILAVGTPHFPGLGFHLAAVPFLFVFVAGISADLLETPQRGLVGSCLLGLLTANAIWNLWQLAQAVHS
jgi:hypothetical protein